MEDDPLALAIDDAHRALLRAYNESYSRELDAIRTAQCYGHNSPYDLVEFQLRQGIVRIIREHFGIVMAQTIASFAKNVSRETFAQTIANTLRDHRRVRKLIKYIRKGRDKICADYI